MKQTIHRELQLPQSIEQVWQAITQRATLAEWMYPNDFEPRVGHCFTFEVPANPQVGFEGLTVACEVLECMPPGEHRVGRLVFSWSAGALTDTQVRFHLESNEGGTRLVFEHAGFDLSQSFNEQAFRGAEYGWSKMLKQLGALLTQVKSDRS